MDEVGIRAFLSKKILGIPAGVFVLLFAAVILFFAWRMRNSAATDTTATDTGAASGDGSQNDTTQQPDFLASDATIPVSTATPVVTQTATNDTNDAWKRRAIEYLMGSGYSVEVATNSISKYLNGEALTDNESKARDAAVKQLGLPPEDIPDVLHKNTGGGNKPDNTPASPQGKPPLNHTVMGNRDNTARELAVLYYGTNDQDALEKIRSANTHMVEPYAVGSKVHIPENYRPRYFKATAHVRTVYDIARRNSTTPDKVQALNPGMNFPVKAGTRVRVH